LPSRGREGGDGHERDEDGAGQGEVLAHDPPGPAGVDEDVGDVVEVLAEQGHVGGLDGDVAAGDAHGDANVGGGQGRGVVDAVAQHRGPPARTELADGGDLVLRSQLGPDVVDAGLAGQSVGGGLVVAREHRDAADAVAAETGDDLGCFGAQLVADGDGAEELVLMFDEDDGAAPKNAGRSCLPRLMGGVPAR
jgi:hypothetical protein